MARTSLLNTDTEDLKELLSNGKTYTVPRYQRDYSWTEEQWEELWEDVVRLETHEDDHYMGSIVLEAGDRKAFRIIDGQQRVATLSILILACIDHLDRLAANGDESNENKDRARLLEASFIGSRDPVSLRVKSKLQLNRNDERFYELNISQRKAPQGGLRTLTDSERQLWECFDYFRKQVAEKFATKRGEDIARFVNETVTERLLFISVRVRDQLSAYTVFETLNARGLELTETDLLKNYLLSLADKQSESQMEPLLAQWNRITDRVGAAQFPELLRYHLNSRHALIREKQLYATVRNTVHDLHQVFPLLDDLERDAAWFEALRDPNSEFWKDYPGAREYVRVLCLFGVTRFTHLVLAAKDVIPNHIVTVLKYCMIVSVRFSGVGRRNPHALEPTYNKAALAIRKTPTVVEAKNCLRDIYIPDDEFKDAFNSLTFSSKGVGGKRLRYFLCEIEKQMAPKELSDETLDATIEHILPASYAPETVWGQAFSEEEHARLVERLGNYTLLERKPNNQLGQAAFSEKKEAFAASQFEMTRKLKMQTEWTVARIENRQRELAKVASAIWRIDFS